PRRGTRARLPHRLDDPSGVSARARWAPARAGGRARARAGEQRADRARPHDAGARARRAGRARRRRQDRPARDVLRRLPGGPVPDDRVSGLHEACDVAVLPRSDGGTSGALVLALSLGLPVVAAAVPAYEELTRRGELGWHFAPGDAASLRAAIEEVAGDEAGRSLRAGRAADAAAA